MGAMTPIRKFRKKPVIVEAMQFDGSLTSGMEAVAWMQANGFRGWTGSDVLVRVGIPTTEGIMYADPGDWIVRGTRGEFYPVKPEPFEDTFEEVYDGQAG